MWDVRNLFTLRPTGVGGTDDRHKFMSHSSHYFENEFRYSNKALKAQMKLLISIRSNKSLIVSWW